MIPVAEIESLAQDVRLIYRRDPAAAAVQIEDFLGFSMQSLDPDRKLAVLAGLKSVFAGSDDAPSVPQTPQTPQAAQLAEPIQTAQPDPSSPLDQRTLGTLLQRLLKQSNVRTELPAEQMLEKISAAMTVIFETLNELVAVMQTTLFGKSLELETIRYVIGSTLEGEGGSRSIEDFLDQIREAFLISHRAFQLAAADKFREILAELEPAVLLARASTGLRRGPFGKAEAFEIFKEKHVAINQWLASARFQHDLLRAFEAQCLKLYSKREENQ